MSCNCWLYSKQSAAVPFLFSHRLEHFAKRWGPFPAPGKAPAPYSSLCSMTLMEIIRDTHIPKSPTPSTGRTSHLRLNPPLP